MKTKEQEIDKLQSMVWGWNGNFEKPIEHSPLMDDTETTCEKIISYCELIRAELKNNQKTKYPECSSDVKSFIQKVIELTCDGRELHKPVEWEGKTWKHHLNENGYLCFENNSFDYALEIIKTCKSILRILKSNKETVNLKDYIGNIYYFENYEDGSVAIDIKDISKPYNEFVFTGTIISFETVDSYSEAFGVLISNVEDYPFDNIPNAFIGHCNTEKDLSDVLDAAENTTFEKIKNKAVEYVKMAFETYEY